ncbi:hypothetical protein [Pseudodesulfovibrio sp.]|uniref:hypothetical protein n=1 Tax=unclassified Pseudodesulfovibrio TaxID=2661612 RepID=UPI003B006525
MHNLKQIIEYHFRIPFPDKVGSDNYELFINELIETDEYYVGLADSYVHGIDIDVDMSYFNVLNDTYNVLSDIEKSQCIDYMDSLSRIVEALPSAHKNE